MKKIVNDILFDGGKIKLGKKVQKNLLLPLIMPAMKTGLFPCFATASNTGALHSGFAILNRKVIFTQLPGLFITPTSVTVCGSGVIPIIITILLIWYS